MSFSQFASLLGVILLSLGCRPTPPAAPGSEQELARQRPGPARNWAPITEWPNAKGVAVDRLEWNRRTLKGAYDQVGTHDGRWDAAARESLEAFAHLRTEFTTNATDQVQLKVAEAISQGCTDPMIKYLGLRFAVGPADSANRAAAGQYRLAAEKLGESAYPAIRKFYGYLRAAQALKSVYGSDTNSGKPYLEFRRLAFGELRGLYQETDLPVAEAVDVAQEFMAVLKDNSTQKLEVFPLIVDCLRVRWPSHALARRVCGRAHIVLGWSVRGSDYANTVAEADWREFDRHLREAERHLEESWRLDSTDVDTAIAMMEVELGQGQGKERLDLWFQRAMAIDPGNHAAAHAKAWYLQPKWHGSVKEVLRFGRDCARSKTWKGKVPLILWESHKLLSTDPATGLKENHWIQPGVWEDVQLSFERFFEGMPQATGWYHDYALYAFKCQQYGKFLDLIPRLGAVREAYFGGELSFENMLSDAENATGRKVERPPRQPSRPEME